MFHSINPATGDVVDTYAADDAASVAAAIAGADTAQRAWRRTPYTERALVLAAVADVLERRRDEHATRMAIEMGKPLSAGRAEIEKCAWVCRYYAEHGASFLADRPIATEALRSYVHHEPLGVVLAVMPWNFPFWQVFRFAAPALMAGNGALLKHASNVCGSALAIDAVFRDAGLPVGLFSTLLLSSAAVHDVIADERVRAVTLTGSEAAGSAVAATAGRHLKKTVLELGGSDAYVVLADADIGEAARLSAASRLINAGQSCIAAKRFIVVDDVHDRFVDALEERLRAARTGDPFDDATEVGPMARVDLRDELHDQVRRSVDAGARCRLGGERPDGPGAYYPPTLLTDVTPGMAAFDEETFGPVAAVSRAASEADAIALANRSSFGLGAAVFTGDVERGAAIAATELDAGAAFVNAFVASDPRLPFGGVKRSGYGRELSDLGIREFVNQKTVVVAAPS